MFSNIILFVTAVLGFLCAVLIFGKNKYHEHSLINKYLIVIITSNAIRFLFHGIAQANPEIDIKQFIALLDVCNILLMPCFYLYFTNIIYESKFELGNLLHFIVPFLFCIIFLRFLYIDPDKTDLITKLFFILVILFYGIYFISGFFMLNNKLWSRTTSIKSIQKQNDLIKNWSIFLYVSFLLVFFIRIITSIITYKYGTFRDKYLSITALVWIGIFIKIILTPEILYGYNLLNKNTDDAAERLLLRSVWNFEDALLPITSKKDIKLEGKIKPLLLDYFHRLEEFSFHTYAFRNPDLSLDDIAMGLKIPVSHVNYILKFHCNESFSDYKKIVRIHDAIKLIELGYLKDYKVESLSSIVGFSSYNTFSIAFKNITGVTVQEYVKRFAT